MNCQIIFKVGIIESTMSLSDDLRTKHEIYLEKYERDGESYLRATRYLLTFIPNHVTMSYDNLFNGDPVLGIYI